MPNEKPASERKGLLSLIRFIMTASCGEQFEATVDVSSTELLDHNSYRFFGEPRTMYLLNGLENHETAHISFLIESEEWAACRGDWLNLPTSLEVGCHA